MTSFNNLLFCVNTFYQLCELFNMRWECLWANDITLLCSYQYLPGCNINVYIIYNCHKPRRNVGILKLFAQKMLTKIDNIVHQLCQMFNISRYRRIQIIYIPFTCE